MVFMPRNHASRGPARPQAAERASGARAYADDTGRRSHEHRRIAFRPPADPQAEALAERIFEASIATMEIAAIHLGDRLGLYRALRDGGPATSAELAARAGTDERYTREWLEQQAVCGILTVEDPAAGARARRFALPAGHAEALLDDGPADLPGPPGPARGGRPGAHRPAGGRVPHRRRGPLRGLRGGHARGHRRHEPAPVPQPARAGVDPDPAGRSRPPVGRPPGPRGRHRLRLRVVEHRPGPGLPARPGRRLRPGRGLGGGRRGPTSPRRGSRTA